MKPYLEGVAPCSEDGGDPKAPIMFSNGSIHSGGSVVTTFLPERLSAALTQPSFLWRILGFHQDCGPFFPKNIEKVFIGDIHQHGP